MSNWPISRPDALRRMQSGSKQSGRERAPRGRARPDRPAREPGEMIVRSFGVVLAVASTTFAAYMISDTERQPQFAGLEHLSIFSKPAVSAARRTQTQIAADQHNKVDYTPVGSISEQRQDKAVPGFVLLGVRSGTALIQTQNMIARVSPGDVVEGLGRITAIERRGDKWVVVTPSGLIVSN